MVMFDCHVSFREINIWKWMQPVSAFFAGWVHSRVLGGTWTYNSPPQQGPWPFPEGRTSKPGVSGTHTYLGMIGCPPQKKKNHCLGCNHLRRMIQLNILVHSDLLLRSNICRSRLLCLIFITCRAHCWSCLSLHVLYDICLNRNGVPCKTQNSYCSYWYCAHYWCVSFQKMSSMFKHPPQNPPGMTTLHPPSPPTPPAKKTAIWKSWR